MFIDKDFHVMSVDNVLDGITYEEIIETAQANGESVKKVFEDILKIRLKDARHLINKYEQELEKSRERINGKDGKHNEKV